MIAINNFLYEKNVPGKVKYKGADLFKAYMGPGPEYPVSSREWREHRHENYRNDLAKPSPRLSVQATRHIVNISGPKCSESNTRNARYSRNQRTMGEHSAEQESFLEAD